MLKEWLKVGRKNTSSRIRLNVLKLNCIHIRRPWPWEKTVAGFLACLVKKKKLSLSLYASERGWLVRLFLRKDPNLFVADDKLFMGFKESRRDWIPCKAFLQMVTRFQMSVKEYLSNVEQRYKNANSGVHLRNIINIVIGSLISIQNRMTIKNLMMFLLFASTMYLTGIIRQITYIIALAHCTANWTGFGVWV